MVRFHVSQGSGRFAFRSPFWALSPLTPTVWAVRIASASAVFGRVAHFLGRGRQGFDCVGCASGTRRSPAREGIKGAVSQRRTRDLRASMMSLQPPGTKLTEGHKAPRNGRSPRPAALSCHTINRIVRGDLRPQYRFEVFHAGASGQRALRDSIPRAGAPTSLRPPHDLDPQPLAPPRFLDIVSRPSRV